MLLAALTRDDLLACAKRAIFCVCTATSSHQSNHSSAYYMQKETKRRTRAESVQPAETAGTGCHQDWDQAADVNSIFNLPGREMFGHNCDGDHISISNKGGSQPNREGKKPDIKTM